jgi:hypothetical protein
MATYQNYWTYPEIQSASLSWSGGWSFSIVRLLLLGPVDLLKMFASPSLIA